MKKIFLLLFMLLFSAICIAKNKQSIDDQLLPEMGDIAAALSPAEINIKDPFAHMSLNTKFIKLHYADADVVGKYIMAKGGLLSKDGRIVIDKRTNAIWIRDGKKDVHTIVGLVRWLDVPVKRVDITARIVSVDEEFARQLGVKWGTVAHDAVSSNNTVQPGSFNFTISKFGHSFALGAELSALASAGHARIISQPRLLTLNRRWAHIQSGEEIPYQEKTGQGDTSVAFKKAVLGLKVRPVVVSKHRLRLDVVVNQDKVSSLSVNGVPAISTREIKTQLLVGSGSTVVLGGVYEWERGNKVVGIPLLGQLPILGALFRHSERTRERKELLVFITPRIVL